MPERRADLEHDLGRVGVQDGWIARPLRLQCDRHGLARHVTDHSYDLEHRERLAIPNVVVQQLVAFEGEHELPTRAGNVRPVASLVRVGDGMGNGERQASR